MSLMLLLVQFRFPDDHSEDGGEEDEFDGQESVNALVVVPDSAGGMVNPARTPDLWLSELEKQSPQSVNMDSTGFLDSCQKHLPLHPMFANVT